MMSHDHDAHGSSNRGSGGEATTPGVPDETPAPWNPPRVVRADGDQVNAAPRLCPLPRDIVRWVEVERLQNGTLIPHRVPVSVMSSPAAWRHTARVIERAAGLFDEVRTSELLLADAKGGTLVACFDRRGTLSL